MIWHETIPAFVHCEPKEVILTHDESVANGILGEALEKWITALESWLEAEPDIP